MDVPAQVIDDLKNRLTSLEAYVHGQNGIENQIKQINSEMSSQASQIKKV